MSPSPIFILNCGSSSIKFMAIEPESGNVLIKGLAENLKGENPLLSWAIDEKKYEKPLPATTYSAAIHEIVLLVRELSLLFSGIGHRVVHGGEYFYESVLIDDSVIKKIKNCTHLAPLHNPVNIIGIEMMQKEFPKLPQVAVFDTAFHQTMPKHAYIYPLPFAYYKKYEVRRYGFHGTSHRFVVIEAAKKLGIPLEKTSFISAHLGNGCSLCATIQGKSVDTSMGMTPLEGLVMGERSGDIDPSLIGYLAETLHCNATDITEILNTKSGLLGISGVSGDMRVLEKEEKLGNERAGLAIQIFCYRLAKYIASFMVPLHHLDALIFTGGIGENSAFIRTHVIRLLKIFGFTLDETKNNSHGSLSQGIISKTSHSPIIMVIPTNEELLIARDTRAVIKNHHQENR